ncbi:MAG: hypothetical protein BWY61_00303 [Firmicutes bacterium ADurb.Bin354]|nr:MAG: hypothetical protein BWY61_00303 [Firmicutes bacterium ADurb.Bin354]
MEQIKINVGDILRLKKSHPCGSFEWEVTRCGQDLKLKCLGCGHVIMQPRRTIVKNIKSVTPGTEHTDN